MQGYGDSAYAESLSEFGQPRHLELSNGWLLERTIPGFTGRDAMGCYPLFVCSDWSRLREDLENVRGDLICVSLIADPLGEYDETHLRECFPDVVVPFKEHFLVDLSQPSDTFIDPHHRRNARRALGELQVEKCASAADHLDDWLALYEQLIERHSITGFRAFSRECFAKQLAVPGLVAFRAVKADVTVGMLLWYSQGNRAYYHLGAFSRLGYELGASFALFDQSLKYFAEHDFQWLNLGAEAGVRTNEKSGLNRFKRGWSTGTRIAYLCGRIFQREKYLELIEAHNVPATKYFPAYRAGEFGSSL